MPECWRSWLWRALLVAVIAAFFHECLFQGHSLVPTDLLHNLMLPYAASVKQVHVQNHYAMDPLTTDYPLGLFWQQSVRRGELPLWNPYILGGHPNLADSMQAVLGPFKLLYLALPAERAFTLGIVLAFVLAGLFMFALLREIGRSHLASLIGSVAWALNSGFMMMYWRAPGVYCWIPLVVLLMERSARRESWGAAFGAGTVLGIAFLSGSIQTAMHLGFLCAAYGACLTWWQEDRARRGRVLARVLVVTVVGALMATPQWLPTLELMRLDAYNDMQARGAWASWRHTLLGLPALITFVFPALTGSTETFDLLKVARASRADFTGYIGVVPFSLFVIAALLARRERRMRGLVLVLVTVLTIVFFTPLVKYVYHRFFVVAVFAMALLAAYGADIVMEPAPEIEPRIRRVWFGMSALCGAVAVGVLAVQGTVLLFGDRLMSAAQNYVAGQTQSHAFAFRPEWFAERVHDFFHHYRLTNVEFWLPLVAAPCAAVCWRAFRRRRLSPEAFGTILILLTVADLSVLGRRVVPQSDLNRYPLQPASAVLSPLANDRELLRVDRWGPNAEYIFRPNSLMAYGLYDLWGNFSLAPETVESLAPVTNDHFNAILDLQNVKYLITQSSVRLPEERFELVTEADGVRLYRNLRCLPRFQFYGQWQIVPDRQQMLERMTADTFNPQETVFLEEAPLLTPSRLKASAIIQVERYTANRVVVRVNATRSGILLLADTWYPGWKARVDGQAAPLYRADHALRATVVPGGEHVVEFIYAPLLFRIGATVGLVTVVTAILLAWVLRKNGQAD